MKNSNLVLGILLLSLFAQFWLDGTSGGMPKTSQNTPGIKPGVFIVGAASNRAVNHPTENISVANQPYGKVSYRRVDFADKQIYWMYHVGFKQTSRQLLNLTMRVEGKGGTFTYFNGKNQLITVPLLGVLPKASGFINTSQATWYISYPTILQTLPKHSVRENYNSLPIRVKQTDKGYDLLISFPRNSGTIGEMWSIGGIPQTLDWRDPLLTKAFELLGESQQMKWSWDGYYDLAPESYVPGGRNVFWRFPDNYVARALVDINDKNKLAKALGWAMLHVGISNQNSKGYWETIPISRWLWKEYGIGSGFMDTRFNTDFARLLLRGYSTYADPAFLKVAGKYAWWLSSYVEQKHITTVVGGREGWLLPDYYWPKALRPTHTSLNHQLAEINLLYNFYVVTGEPKFKMVAEKLLIGIRNTRTFWVKPDGNLRYGYLKGKEVGVDYPYLTYNDLWETQQYIVQIYGGPDKDIGLLMASKKRWMDKQGITGYKK